MKHMMMDCYGAINFKLDDMTGIYDLLNGIAHHAKLQPVAPPTLIPYYYCEDKDDVGISAYLFLKGGHITIHTFSKRECYFVDIMSDSFFNAEMVYNYLEVHLPFNKSISNYCVSDRRITEHSSETVTEDDFGPHLVGRLRPREPLTLDRAFHALERLVEAANMTPICRAAVIKDSSRDPHFVQGIIVIAQSHISLYYDIENDVLYFDLFSCAYFDFSRVEQILTDMFGESESMQLVKRGDKYVISRSDDIDASISYISGKWQQNI
ncbi:MAG: S-adenosylmethionine decarboxylase [Clostridia bacterium]|nr:S-adenosylmethionine decarboxylase [Clostridia bacterium]